MAGKSQVETGIESADLAICDLGSNLDVLRAVLKVTLYYEDFGLIESPEDRWSTVVALVQAALDRTELLMQQRESIEQQLRELLVATRAANRGEASAPR